MFGIGGKRSASPAFARHHTIVSWAPGCVYTSVVEMESGSAQIVGLSSQSLEPHVGVATEQPDVDSWATHCDESLSQAEDMTVRHCGRKLVPDWATMSVPVETTRSHPIVVRRTRREPSSGVTEQEIQSLLKLGYRSAQDETSAPSQATSAPTKADEDIVFGSVAEVSLDGQVVVDPLGLHGEQIQIRLNFFLLPLPWIRALEIVCDRLGLCLQSIVPQQAAYASPLPDPECLLFVVEPHCTSIGLVRRGRLEWAVLANIGADDVVEQAANTFDLRGQQSRALISAYRGGRLQQDLELKLARAFWRKLRQWMRTLAETIGDSARGPNLPHRIYVVDASQNLPEAVPCLQTPFWEQLLPFERCPEAHVVDAGMVRKVLDLTAQASAPRFLPIRTLAHLAAQVYTNEHSLDAAMIDIVRWQTPKS